jgi:transcription elongation factor SPT5
VFVEARKEAHIQPALQGIPELKSYKLKIVPINEMISSITIERRVHRVKPKDWVRIKRGLYKGDLAQVLFAY